jgi:hypothetical protein
MRIELLLVDPLEEAVGDRLGLPLAPRALGRPGQFVLSDLRLACIQGADPFQRLLGMFQFECPWPRTPCVSNLPSTGRGSARSFSHTAHRPHSIGLQYRASLLAMYGQLNVPALIGMIMLLGIVTKNPILLVENAMLGRQREGLAVFDALMAACRHRARPIVMTTVRWWPACCRSSWVWAPTPASGGRWRSQ